MALTLGSTPVTAHADVLDDLAIEFTTAQGAGQIPALLNQSLRLRGAGYNLTNGEMAAIQDALTRRPNQTPLINALKDAVSGQTQRMKQNKIAQSAGQPVRSASASTSTTRAPRAGSRQAPAASTSGAAVGRSAVSPARGSARPANRDRCSTPSY